MSLLATWLVQLRQGSLSAAAFRQNVEEALLQGRLNRDTVRTWIDTPSVQAALPPRLVREISQLVPAGRAPAGTRPEPAGPAPARPGTAQPRRAVPGPGAPAAPAAVVRTEPDVGMVIDGRYELTARLGGGGMGDVFKALDRLAHSQQDPDPYLAIKILKARMQTNQKAVLALQREANRARRLTHSNILRVHQFEQDRDTGQYFMVMELLEGRSVESVMYEAQDGQTWSQIAPMIEQVCEGLSYAHEQGIIHSDIKPSNLFLSKNGRIKILDFGIAAPIPSQTGHETLMDARKLGARTPAYASMETFLGIKPHYSDDVYSLACVIYEWISTRPPYAKPQDPYTPVPAPAALKLNLQPAPIPSLSRAQNQALRKALALRRSERTQTIQEFWKSMAEAPSSFSLRSRAPIWWGLGAALVLAGVGLYFSGLPRRAATTVAAAPTCPSASSPGALDTALRNARVAREALGREAAGSPQRQQAAFQVSQSVQCLRSLSGAGVDSPESAQLLQELQTLDAR